MVEERVNNPVKDNAEILEKVYHTDARVSAMESQMADMSHSMGRIESLLLNRQTNPLSIVGIMLTALTLLGGLLFGMAQIMHLTMAPVSDDVAEHREALDSFVAFKENTQYKFGALEEWQKSETNRLNRISGRVDDIDDRMRDTGEEGRGDFVRSRK